MLHHSWNQDKKIINCFFDGEPKKKGKAVSRKDYEGIRALVPRESLLEFKIEDNSSSFAISLGLRSQIGGFRLRIRLRIFRRSVMAVWW